ncbi:MAG: class I SAM-dependent methyltransferase [Phycisphaerae bacterium]|nr:class I SAM-dependent methyltransferase [Phycisphaerae bacterium]
MKKPYEGHEIEYKRMEKKGIRSWGERRRIKGKAIDKGAKRFLSEVLGQRWCPKGGRVIELGCGTGPILRLICKKGFSGLGIDVCKTAIAMAKEQSKGLNVRFKQADICGGDVKRMGKFDLAIDGHCLHCIIQPEDRKAFFENSFKLLKKGGLFVVMTMCSPANRRIFSDVCKGQKLINNIVYAPYDRAGEYEGFRKINGLDYMPTRKVPHWKSILSEIQKTGFKIKLLRYDEADEQEPFGDLRVAALR